MRGLLRSMAVAFSAGALGMLGALVLTSLLGRARVGPAQPDVQALLVGGGALWGLALTLFLGQPWPRLLLAGALVGLAMGILAWWQGGPWPQAGGPWAPAWTGGYGGLWGFFAGLVAAWLGEPGEARGGGGRGRKR